MNCSEVQARLTALLDGELTEATAVVLQAHLAECAACAQDRVALEKIRSQADAWKVSGGDVWEAVRQEIETVDFVTVMQELQALRNEVRTLRAEVATLRRQSVAAPSVPPSRPGVLLFPYTASEEPPLSIV